MGGLKKNSLAHSWWIIPILFLGVALLAHRGDLHAEVAGPVPEISFNRSTLNFGSVRAGDVTSTATDPQRILISNSGGGTLEWVVGSSGEWLICSPTSGINSGAVTVSVAPCGLAAGSYSGTVQVYAHGASNSPQTIPVVLDVKEPAQDLPPFGSFDTPIQNSTVRGSIPVTGWVLDDTQVNTVKIYNGSDYVGDAMLVEGARPDVEQKSPTYPNNYQAGWGYMLLTNFLPGGGNGSYTIYAIATDSEGQQTTLGSRTIYCDNANAVKPFGAIDTPTQGGTASGTEFVNWGWALTPQPNFIPTDGSTIHVYLDGVNIGHPQYNVYRMDVAALFPDFSNSSGAAGYFYLDTTGYADGVHTIQWTATDNAGNADGIGSRYFTIDNSGPTTYSESSRVESKSFIRAGALDEIPTDYTVPVQYRTGYDESAPLSELLPDSNGVMYIAIRESDRIEVHLNETGFAGSRQNGDTAGPLPIGSALDAAGTFYWIPGPGFAGDFEFVFTRGEVEKTKKVLKVTILPGQAPLPRIKANGQKGIINVPSGASVAVTISLDLNNYASQSGDWWVVTYTPDGQWGYFNLNTMTFVAGLATTYQGPLFEFNDIPLINLTNLSAGPHSFFFGMDMNKNGSLDADELFYDSVSVVVTQ